jgi:pilus assembly protein Flp/PilA
MWRIQSFTRAFWQDESGVSAIEYALVASLIAMIILSAVVALGGALLALWNRVAGCVTDPSSCT